MQAKIEEAFAHLGAALMQTAPTDDQIIIGHVRDAHALLKTALRQPPSNDSPRAPSEAEYHAKLCDDLRQEAPHKDNVGARMALAIAARAIRRGRHLTPAEKMENLRRAMAEADAEEAEQ